MSDDTYLLEPLALYPEKRAALSRRANKLIEWLQRNEYAFYENEESITRMVKLIDLIIWALQRSIPYEDWHPFELRLKDARYLLTDIYETEEQVKINFKESITGIITTLQDYLDFVR